MTVTHVERFRKYLSKIHARTLNDGNYCRVCKFEAHPCAASSPYECPGVNSAILDIESDIWLMTRTADRDWLKENF
jgi:hypothetical protein